jgi:hypothetical protein
VTRQAGRAAARERRRTRAWPKTCLAVDLNRHSPLAMSRERPGTHAWPKPCLARGQQPQRTAHDVTRRHPDFHVGRSPVWRHGPPHSRIARNLPRPIPNARMAEALFGEGTTAPTHRSRRDETPPRLPCGRSPVWRHGPPHSRIARNLPRPIPNARMGEALFGGPTHGARTNAASRAEHLAWPPVWDGAS